MREKNKQISNKKFNKGLISCEILGERVDNLKIKTRVLNLDPD
jgi:hypothetical protein